MKLLFLGTGTSHGVPMIGCTCAVCRSTDPHNQRARTSALVTRGTHRILIDAPAELRLRALAYGLGRVDAVLLTHAHADHVSGLDDLRTFNLLQGTSIPVYCSSETGDAVRRRFDYIFNGLVYPGKPNLELHIVEDSFELFGRTITTHTLPHGELFRVTGYRLGRFGYVTDASAMPAAVRRGLRGLDVLVLNALRHRPHPAHLSLDEALAIVDDLQPQRAFFTHIAHDLDHATVNATLPPAVRLAHDGLEVEIDDEEDAG